MRPCVTTLFTTYPTVLSTPVTVRGGVFEAPNLIQARPRVFSQGGKMELDLEYANGGRMLQCGGQQLGQLVGMMELAFVVAVMLERLPLGRADSDRAAIS